ncbi:cation diffusion facilitator family transporter [Geothrix sp. PMB-07]|uniref:cation diffusion facilitator family transporter n=1 Tax=Geothrix sp. PMB-07 TaxID=3068640 RepID=UPI002742761D|nr:cation diffusion facilitator family transporter [Geothrix sp. PMB-07]WLT30240.1 cation diffusion facilitator family transporter [Geothrix sp. PMB-07]
MSAAEHLQQKARIRLALLSIAAGAGLLGLKYLSFVLSGSVALKSDAIESIVNVVAAVFALGAVIFAGRPADKEHPYGHGKIEHFSAAFEGGLISLAAVFIILEGARGLIYGVELKDLGKGLAVNLFAGSLNGLLGWYMLKQGRKTRSRALEADGHHILSDFWTTMGIALGLLAVKLTGIHWLDPLMALAVGLLLARTGFRLVKESSQALLDMEDPDVLHKVLTAMNGVRTWDILAVHEMRTFRSGRYTHVDVHIVVPEFYPVRQAHDLCEGFGEKALEAAAIEGEVHTHVDPCGRLYCSRCPAEPCSIRVAPRSTDATFTLEEATAAGPA